ncbi:YceI family protein [Dyadobacter psychrotolerans]|uniref:YceI family protein n=1 Tax=Dyadobacter psychrotolerans TaxID=2541721 RepID=A0A4R5DJW8_9BACT|nr:YceI family protein [Dyadobacter psychrotolerans]TDE14436.1 YceI family protein [Dyadobacter psychrotolerans]
MKINRLMKNAVIIILAALLTCGCNSKSTEHYRVDRSKSVVEWKGYLKNGDFNSGTISVKSDSMIVKDGKVVAGSFSMPLSSMVNKNLPNDALKKQIVHHLQSADFFNMAMYPAVQFTMTGIVSYSGRNPEAVAGAQHLISGDLAILGEKHSISFPAKIILDEEKISVEGKVSIDRTRWSMTYASDESSPDGLYIKPFIDLHLKLFGRKIQD